MIGEHNDSCEREHGLSAALVACLEAIDNGQTDRQELLARYPQFVTELGRFLDDQAQVDRYAAPLRCVAGRQTPQEMGGASQQQHISIAIPQELETIVLKAMERNPADRYATAQELADDLRNFVEDRPIRAKRPSLLHRLGRWRRRHKPLVWSGAALVFTVLLLGGAALGWHQRQLAATEQAVGEDLRQADLLQKQERWSRPARITG